MLGLFNNTSTGLGRRNVYEQTDFNKLDKSIDDQTLHDFRTHVRS